MVSDKTEPSSQQHPYHPEVHHDIFPSGRSFVNWMLMSVCGFACLIVALTAVYFIKPELKPGDLVERDIIAIHDALVEDAVETQKAREKAKNTIIPVFKIDASRDQTVVAQVKHSLDLVKQIQDAGLFADNSRESNAATYLYLLELSDAEFARQIASGHKGDANLSNQRLIWKRFRRERQDVTQSEALVALSLLPSQYPMFQRQTMDATVKLLSVFKRLPADDKAQWEVIIGEFLPDAWPSNLRHYSAHIISKYMEPNLAIDESATRAKAEETAAHLNPIMRPIHAGEKLVSRGTRLIERDIELLKSVGVAESNRWPMILSLWLSVAAAVALTAGFLYTYEPRHLFQTSSVGLMFTIAILTCAAASAIGKVYPQFIPLPAAALVWTIFFGRRVASALTLPVVIILAVDQLVDPWHLIALGTASGAAIGGYSRTRNSLMVTGVLIGLMQALGYLIASVLVSPTELGWSSLGHKLGYELFGGVMSAMLAIGSLPFLENIFGMITPFRLAEITDADQPLLRALEEKAPGTYQHSLAVANLAEAGARAIAADVNLVRAGALYHDIGKMARPKYFIENQLGDKNPHDSMAPEESRERVLAHVTDGIDLAKKYSLPKAVQDFIPMHQGTSLMAYFYHKACVRDGSDKVDPMFYRYPGPKPQSKETAIVMLADVSEAVTHSMHDPTQQEVEEAMTKVFQNRWDDKQFDETALSFAELFKVRDAFVHVWRTLHHERLKYPSTTTGKMAIAPEIAMAPNEVQTDEGKDKNQEPNPVAYAAPKSTTAGDDSQDSATTACG